MRTITLACALTFAIATEVLAAPLDKPREAAPPLARDTPIGSGPYPAIIAEDPRLPKHTIYRPGNLEALGSRMLPIVAWGNGGCFDNGTAFRWFLSEVASYGFLVIANGSVGADPLPSRSLPRPAAAPRLADLPPPATHTAQLLQAIDWAQAENKRNGSPLRGHLATDRVAVMGQSCGGVQAIEAASDPRVNTAMIWNSGMFPAPTAMGGGRTLDKRDLAKLHGPAAYISGDVTDIAFVNANDDFRQITGIPVFRAYERGVTHGGTYSEPNGGEFAGVAVAWLLWQLQGDSRASLLFTGGQCGLCVNPRWVVEKKRIH